MLSAPAAIPAMIAVSFAVEFAAPALTRSHPKRTCSSSTSLSPACSARSINGTRPAAEIRFASSNTAASAVQAWDPCTESVSLNCADQVVANPIIPGQKALSLSVRPPSPTPVHGSRLSRPSLAGGRSSSGRSWQWASWRNATPSPRAASGSQWRRAGPCLLAVGPRERSGNGRECRSRRVKAAAVPALISFGSSAGLARPIGARGRSSGPLRARDWASKGCGWPGMPRVPHRKCRNRRRGRGQR